MLWIKSAKKCRKNLSFLVAEQKNYDFRLRGADRTMTYNPQPLYM